MHDHASRNRFCQRRALSLTVATLMLFVTSRVALSQHGATETEPVNDCMSADCPGDLARLDWRLQVERIEAAPQLSQPLTLATPEPTFDSLGHGSMHDACVLLHHRTGEKSDVPGAANDALACESLFRLNDVGPSRDVATREPLSAVLLLSPAGPSCPHASQRSATSPASARRYFADAMIEPGAASQALDGNCTASATADSSRYELDFSAPGHAVDAPPGTMFIWRFDRSAPVVDAQMLREGRTGEGWPSMGAGMVLSRPPGPYSLDWIGVVLSATIY